MLKLGIILTAATVTILVVEFFRARRRPFPAHGWLGLVSLLCAEFLMFQGIEPAATYFSPAAWTSYILIADAAVFAITGHSRLREEPRGLLKMAALSIPLWLIFEAYNLRLANWAYMGLPQGAHRKMDRLRMVFRDDHAGNFHDRRAHRIVRLVQKYLAPGALQPRAGKRADPHWCGNAPRSAARSGPRRPVFIRPGVARVSVSSRTDQLSPGLAFLRGAISREEIARASIPSWLRAGCAAGFGNSGITGRAPDGIIPFPSASN